MSRRTDRWTPIGAVLTPLEPDAAVFTAEQYAELEARRQQKRLEYLVELRPTPQLQERYGFWLNRKADPTHRTDATYWLGVYAKWLEDAEERDRLELERPVGCWCLGLGGSGRRYLPIDGASVYVFDEYCDCEDALRIQQQHREQAKTARAHRALSQEERLLLEAGFPERYRDKTFETFGRFITPETAPTLRVLRKWALQDEHWLLLWGAFGTGKTGLAISAAKEAISGRAASVRFVNVPEWLGEMRATYDPETPNRQAEATIIGQLTATQVLILDDLGAERMTGWVEEVLYRAVNTRYANGRQTVVTTNLSPQELEAHVGQRIADRIVESCGPRAKYLLNVAGQNVRELTVIPGGRA